MAKELPYFQFEPAEYLTKDISFCSLAAQGLFINLCAYYWQRECNLTKMQFLRRLNHENEFNELISENIIKCENEVIIIDFLDRQYEKATSLKKTNSINGSKGGRPKKINPIESEIKPKQNPIESETISELKGIREDKIIENKIKVNKNKENKTLSDFDFTFIEFEKMRKAIKKPLTENAKKLIVEKLQKLAPNNEQEQILILQNSIVNSWAGVFELKKEDKPQKVWVDTTSNNFKASEL